MGVGCDMAIRFWYDEAQDLIKIIVGDKLTSVNNNPKSPRGNPSLYRLLAAALKDAGEKYPDGII